MGARIRRKIAAGKNRSELKTLRIMVNHLAAYVDEHVNNTVVMFRTVVEATDTEQKVKDLLSQKKSKAMEAQSAVPQPTDTKEEAK